ncbi:MAG TPA: hypothetical protein VLA19_29850 [Herpetosiphonaceae bacterium]|nr:hypothetical protein [Herpetosiphonaceae bacterium]
MGTVETVGIVPNGRPIRGLTLARHTEELTIGTDTIATYRYVPGGGFVSGPDLGSACNRMIRSGIGQFVFAATDGALMKVFRTAAYDVRRMVSPRQCLAVGYASRGRYVPPGAPPPAEEEPAPVVLSPVSSYESIYHKALLILSGESPPAGFGTVAFDDSGWTPAARGTRYIIPDETIHELADKLYNFPTSKVAEGSSNIVRQTFGLPSGTITPGTLKVGVENNLHAGYLNGTLLNLSGGSGTPYNVEIPVPPGVLLPGKNNVLAFHFSGGGYRMGVAWKLTYGTS